MLKERAEQARQRLDPERNRKRDVSNRSRDFPRRRTPIGTAKRRAYLEKKHARVIDELQKKHIPKSGSSSTDQIEYTFYDEEGQKFKSLKRRIKQKRSALRAKEALQSGATMIRAWIDWRIDLNNRLVEYILDMSGHMTDSSSVFDEERKTVTKRLGHNAVNFILENVYGQGKPETILDTRSFLVYGIPRATIRTEADKMSRRLSYSDDEDLEETYRRYNNECRRMKSQYELYGSIHTTGVDCGVHRNTPMAELSYSSSVQSGGLRRQGETHSFDTRHDNEESIYASHKTPPHRRHYAPSNREKLRSMSSMASSRWSYTRHSSYATPAYHQHEASPTYHQREAEDFYRGPPENGMRPLSASPKQAEHHQNEISELQEALKRRLFITSQAEIEEVRREYTMTSSSSTSSDMKCKNNAGNQALQDELVQKLRLRNEANRQLT